MLPALIRVEVPAPSLRPGMQLEIDAGTPHQTTATILRVEPRFNPCFLPVVLDLDPHAATDIDVDTLVAAWASTDVVAAAIGDPGWRPHTPECSTLRTVSFELRTEFGGGYAYHCTECGALTPSLNHPAHPKFPGSKLSPSYRTTIQLERI
jgi:hypothetical protein